MNRKQACSAQDRLSKVAFLAMLFSNLDETRAIVVATGEVLNLSNYEQYVITSNINSKTWTYYEKNSPRKMFLLNPNWVINSFDPATRNVCVTMTTNSRQNVFNLTLPKIYGKS